MPIPSYAVAPPATRGAGRRCDRSSLHQRALEQNGLDRPLPVEEEFDRLITHGPIGKATVICRGLMCSASSRNTILDSGHDGQVCTDRTLNAVRPTPTVGPAAAEFG